MFDDFKKTLGFTRRMIGARAEQHRLRSRALQASGPISAVRAVELAAPIIAGMDGGATPVHIASDSNLRADGLARRWDLFYDLPGRGVQLNAIIAPCDEADVDNDAPPLCMTFRELAMKDRKPPLPMPFRDSPQAVADLAAEGIDFVSGPTDITLSTHRAKDGTVKWEVQAGGRKAMTAFTE